ncbi:MAG: methyltransferase [Candidatus Aenigmarchaeota archaeon]|nr:methyltransferase [Candidatus Aenigmarchaeota archaeon]
MGKVFFRSIVLETEEVYEPREDSFLFAHFLENLDLKGKKILEIGCGSGLLSILCSKGKAEVTAVDINEKAVECTLQNAEKNGCKIKAFQSDLFSFVQGKFDIILFNSPYLPVDEEKEWSAGEGSELILKFIENCKIHLFPNGRVLLLISSLTGLEKVLQAFRQEGFKTKSVAEESLFFEKILLLEASQ